MKKISEFLSENFQFLEVKSSIYLYRRVFVMEMSFSIPANSISVTETLSETLTSLT